MQDLWARIIAWFINNKVPPHAFALAPGVTEQDIRRAEVQMQLDFPPDLRASYLLHNGSKERWIFQQGFLLALDDVVDAHFFKSDALRTAAFENCRANPKGAIKREFWNARWIPITDNGTGDHICVDMDPANGGNKGQIIATNHETGPIAVLADSFREWLTTFATDLELGKYQYDEKSFVIRKRCD